jgi:selenide,water dikinase
MDVFKGGGQESTKPPMVLRSSDWGRWVRKTLLLLADAQTSGALLVAGELPGAPVTGELVRRRDSALTI